MCLGNFSQSIKRLYVIVWDVKESITEAPFGMNTSTKTYLSLNMLVKMPLDKSFNPLAPFYVYM